MYTSLLRLPRHPLAQASSFAEHTSLTPTLLALLPTQDGTESKLTNGGAVWIAAQRADLKNTFVGILLARQVNGDVRVLLDRKAAAIFGLSAGLIIGLLGLLRWPKRR